MTVMSQILDPALGIQNKQTVQALKALGLVVETEMQTDNCKWL